MSTYLAPGTPAWYLCRDGGWVFTWADSPHPPALLPRRPTPLLLAQAGVSQRQHLPPPGPATDWLTLKPGHVRLSQLPDLWRHWLWWRRNLDRAHLRRGDLIALVNDPRPTVYAPSAPQRLDLTREHHYAHLVNTALACDLWVRRYRGPRRRRVTIATSPPGPTGLRRTLLWAHHPRADLTWAPRPPHPPDVRAARTARRRRRRRTAVKSTLLILLLGPIGLLMVLLGLGRHKPSTLCYLPPSPPLTPRIGSVQDYATYWHTTGYKYHRW